MLRVPTDTLAAKIMTVVDGVEPEPGKVSKARLQFDAYRWHAGKLAPKKYDTTMSRTSPRTRLSRMAPIIRPAADAIPVVPAWFPARFTPSMVLLLPTVPVASILFSLI